MNHRKATRIAKHALMQCLTPDGIVAGTHHFVDLWARDSLFATFGSGASSAKTTIETFIKFQRNDGLIPYRVMWSKTTLAKYFGKPTLLDEPVAQYRSRQSGGLVLDGGLMTVITAFEYVHRSGDIRFFQKHQAQLEQVMHWYERRFGDGLLSEWFQCEWADGVLKAGQTLYTNVLYWKALGDIGDHTRQRFIGKLIRERLWNGKFFADWTDWKRQDYFASHPNMLAIIFGLANSAETEKILDFIIIAIIELCILSSFIGATILAYFDKENTNNNEKTRINIGNQMVYSSLCVMYISCILMIIPMMISMINIIKRLFNKNKKLNNNIID